MPHVCEYHRQAEAVGGGDYFGVFYRASGLNHGGGAGLGGLFGAVGEREEGVGSDGSSLQRVLRFQNGAFFGNDAGHLFPAPPPRWALLSGDAGVGLSWLSGF